jgi:hypothetical protein
MRQLFPRRRAASTSRAFSQRIQASEQCTRVPRSNGVGRCDADRGERASRALDRHAAPPGRRSPPRRASRLPGLGWTDARRCNPFAVPHRLLRLDRGDLRAAQRWTRPTHFRKPRRLRASDWRRTSPVPARPQPSGDPRPARPCLVPTRRWSARCPGAGPHQAVANLSVLLHSKARSMNHESGYD